MEITALTVNVNTWGYIYLSAPYGIFFSTGQDAGGAPALVERMRIDSQGRVGIGTQIPQYALDVAGDIHTNGNMFLTNLPTSDPGVPGQLWRSGNQLMVS